MATIDDIVNGTFSSLGYGGAPVSGGARGLTLNASPAPTGGSPYMTPAEKEQWNNTYVKTPLNAGMVGRGLPASAAAAKPGDVNRMDQAMLAARPAPGYAAWGALSRALAYNGMNPDPAAPTPRAGPGIPVLNNPTFDPWAGARLPGQKPANVPGMSLGHVAGDGTFPGENPGPVAPMAIGVSGGYTYARTPGGAMIKTGRDPTYAGMSSSEAYAAVNNAAREAAGRNVGSSGNGSSSGNLGGVSSSGRRYDYDRNEWVGGSSSSSGGGGGGGSPYMGMASD